MSFATNPVSSSQQLYARLWRWHFLAALLVGWYKRRPRGGPIAPPKRDVRLPKAVLAIGAALCIVLPMLGLSVAMIARVDSVLVRVLKSEK
jgi:uncharacterized iron-regulated membrane protein